LTLVDEKRKVLKRISLSRTDEAARALAASAIPFHDIEIPLQAKDNLLIKTVQTGKTQVTNDWKHLFTPTLTDEQAHQNQHAAGIKTSMVFPVTLREKTIGAVIFSMVKKESEVDEDEINLLRGFCDIIGIAVQNSKLYTTLEERTNELKDANRQLKELDQLKDEFVSIASHELRTPMTAIKDYLWMALAGKGGELTEKQRYYLTRSFGATERLIKLVNDLLNISRIESGRVSLEVAKVDLNQLIFEVIEEVLARATQLGVQIEYARFPEPVFVIADPDKIKEVLINLIGNSLKFTDPGGSITVSYKTVGKQIVTTVTDTGVGISSQNVTTLFQKFGLITGSYRTNQAAGQGTGLGLYISRSIIELHQGKIWAESEGVGKGSTFAFSLLKYSKEQLTAIEAQFADKSDAGIIRSVV
jgi:signal transduction histidine kinase